MTVMSSHIGDELYALPPAEFTAARDSHVAQARQNGDKAGAAEVAAFKRPTQAAWLVNLLALRAPDVVTELIDLGAAIRDAQGAVPPAQLRDLSSQRRKALDAALARARKLAEQAGQPAPSRAQLDEVEGSLAAAMADEEAARQVRAGRLVKPLRYSGFGPLGTASTGTVTSTAKATPARKAAPAGGGAKVDEAAEAEQRAEAQARREAAEERVAEAERALDDATADERDANAEVERLTDELAALREALEAAQLASRSARQTRIAAERDLESANRRLRAASS
jgi:hypothetical protein